MGAGKRQIVWPWEEGFKLEHNLPFLAGGVLLVMGACFLGCFLCPCTAAYALFSPSYTASYQANAVNSVAGLSGMGRCCSDRTQFYSDTKKERAHGLTPAHRDHRRQEFKSEIPDRDEIPMKKGATSTVHNPSAASTQPGLRATGVAIEV